LGLWRRLGPLRLLGTLGCLERRLGGAPLGFLGALDRPLRRLFGGSLGRLSRAFLGRPLRLGGPFGRLPRALLGCARVFLGRTRTLFGGRKAIGLGAALSVGSRAGPDDFAIPRQQPLQLG
jgi:hypothetical protein